MSTASMSLPARSAAYIEIQAETHRESAEALLRRMYVPTADEQAAVRPSQRAATRLATPAPTAAVQTAKESHASTSHRVEINNDASQTFCEWLAAVRELQKDPWERKRTISSFAMLVFHTAIDSADSVAPDSLSREQLEMISKAPGWNENEIKILDVLKTHFYTIRELSASNQQGICYTDLQSLFAGKKKLRDVQRVAASTLGAKSGFGAGLCVQVLFMLVALQFGLGLSLLFAIIGALVGLVLQQTSEGAVRTALAGAFWGISAGSAIGAGLGAKRAGEYFDANLSIRIDDLRQDLKTLRFE